MASFVVMQAPSGASPEADPELVRDAFSIWALIAPPIWLARYKLWLEAALALGAILLIPALAAKFGLGLISSTLTYLLAGLVALEGPQMRLAQLRRKGWSDAGVVEADNLEDAEIRQAFQDQSDNWGPWSPKVS